LGLNSYILTKEREGGRGPFRAICGGCNIKILKYKYK